MGIVMALLGGFLSIAASMVGRVLLALGMGYVTYKGFDLGIAWLLTQIKQNIGSMPAEVISFLGFLWVDKALGVMFSAYTAASLIRMAGGANLKKLVMK
jgi:hypothetical protein